MHTSSVAPIHLYFWAKSRNEWEKNDSDLVHEAKPFRTVGVGSFVRMRNAALWFSVLFAESLCKGEPFTLAEC